MASSEAMYVKVSVDTGDGAQRSVSSRVFKAGIAFIGGSCLVVLTVMAISASSPTVQSTSAAESTSLFGLPTSLRSAKQPSAVLPQTMRNLPGSGPWKELALAGLEGANRCDRDISMNAANVKKVFASMDSKTQATVRAAADLVITKAEELKAGQTAPMGFFDPLGFATKVEFKQLNGNMAPTNEISMGRLLFYREAELKHGRICMLAFLGIVVGEVVHPFYGGAMSGTAMSIAAQVTQVDNFWFKMAIALSIPEIVFSMPTISIPDGADYTAQGADVFSLKPLRVPGDFGYDPMGLKPKDDKEFLDMQNKELNNGRLAMLAVAGMLAQEAVTGQATFR
eukprot:gnl/MRDRNA2_/MRDRNA2_96922_c0_seq1.p1 gnl/MRDRNA2_/MRDRNA2_96922_c0~~gnl/MRDRNA2_/MRDRNA2_96922_c0_seq1.p1  ORF type:complete len:339 (+),score=75.60 gnl/MRDRNA2_/MRDRNA2_96922_c0_seq1:89-1105(+)